jgi:hypothetical protein
MVSADLPTPPSPKTTCGARQCTAKSSVRASGSERVIVLLCNKTLLGGFVKVTNLPYLEGFCYVTKPSTWRVGVT